MMYKKIINIFLAIVMVLGIIDSSLGKMLNMKISDVKAEETVKYPFGYESGDVFASETLLGISKDENGDKLGFVEFASRPILKDYTYKTLAEGIIDREWLISDAVFWKNASSCLSGEFVDLVTWKQVMYETLIMDWLTYQFESDDFQSEFQNDTNKFVWKITKYLLKKGDIYDENDLGKMSVEDAMKYLDDDFYKQNEILENIDDFNEAISDIQKVVKTGADFYEQFSKVLAARNACKSRIEFLKKVKQVSDNEDLCRAIDVVIDKLNDSIVKVAFSEIGFTMLKSTCEIAWDLITENCYIPALSELKLGMAGMNWLFNNEDKSTSRVQLLILYIINADFTKAYQDLKSQFINNKTEYNANLFNNAYIDYTLYQAYASNITKEYIGNVLFEGAANQIYNLFSSNNINTYNDLEKMLDSDIDISKRYRNLLITYYKLYNDILDTNLNEIKNNKDEIPISDIRFERNEVKIDLKNKVSLFSENILITPENAANKDITYTSSDSSIMSITNQQPLTIEVHKEGIATITATTSNGKTATCKITVTNSTVAVTSVSLNKTSLSLVKGDATTLSATVNPSNATNKALTWTSSNPSVATVDQNGRVTAINAGTTTITVITGNGKTATCTVTVTNPTISITSIGLDKTSLTLNKNATATLKATINPSNTTDSKALTWKSSNTKVATVNNQGKITAKANGTATITVKTVNGKTAACKVTVKTLVSKLTYSKVTNKTYTGKQIKLSITVKDGKKTLKKGTDYTVSYGKNKSTGKATITIKGKGNYTGSKTINFYIVPKKVTISSVKPGKKQLTVKYKKVTGASGYQIAYSTSKSKGFKYITVNSKTASKVIKKLKSKKKYYVKVRAYKTIGKKKYYGSYSNIKSVKVN